MGSRPEDLRPQLEGQAERLRAELAALARNSRPTSIGQRPIDGGDIVDQASASTSREQSRFRAAMLGQRLDQVLDALRRIDDGTYGRCRVCDGRISKDRLEVLPTTTLCLADQEGFEHGAVAPARAMATADTGTVGGRRG